jgi:hypothetical protein
MKNKNLIIGGAILVGIVAYYFYNKNKVGIDSVNTPKPYDNTANCEGQYTKYLSSLPPKLTKEYISPKEEQEIKQNWIKNNCKLAI